ncbi:MAG: glycosyltransferase family 2 protein, partial [Pseudomonadota bacterium]
SHKTAVFMRKIGILKPVMTKAIFDELTPSEFYRLYRARRDLRWWKNAVAGYFMEKGRNELANAFGVAFRKRLRRIERQRVAAEDEDEGFTDPEANNDLTDVDEEPAQDETRQTSGVQLEAPKPVIVPHVNRPMGERGNDRCAIVTTMKNEGPFMLEWVAYNRSIGFTDFLIYTNDCDDGTDLIASRLEELGVAHHVENRFKSGASPQRVALRRALQHPVYQHSDWIMCADCDEFLNIRTGDGCLPDLFEAVGEADAISICWKLFGCGDQIKYEDRFVHENFVWSAPEDFRERYRGLGLKTLLRPSVEIRKIGVHRPKFYDQPEGFLWKDAGGQALPGKYFEQGWSAYGGFDHSFARLHHYAVRSAESFLVKRDRGRTNHIDRDQGIAYWADMNINLEEDTSLVSGKHETKSEFNALLEDPELARLHAEACAWHRAKIAALRSNPEWAALFEKLQGINRPGEDLVDRGALADAAAAE